MEGAGIEAGVHSPSEVLVTPPVTPEPKEVQSPLFHLAMQFALVSPPAVMKSPATKRSSPQAARALTGPSTPPSTPVQLVPTSRAKYLMFVLPPAAVKSPPIKIVWPIAVMVRTPPAFVTVRPLPTRAQFVPTSLETYWMLVSPPACEKSPPM